MDERNLDELGGVLQAILDAPGAWEEKAQAIMAHAKRRGWETALEEFITWFDLA